MTQLNADAQSSSSSGSRPEAAAAFFTNKKNVSTIKQNCDLQTACCALPEKPHVPSGPENEQLSSEIAGSDNKAANNSDTNDNQAMAVVQPTLPTICHREMAVDCPDSFVAVAKTTPKYPPPKKITCQEARDNMNKSGLYYFTSDNFRNYDKQASSQDSPEDSRRTPPTPRIAELMEDNESVPVAEEKATNGNIIQKGGSEKMIGSDHLQRIKKYQDDIRMRKEQGERLAFEDEFLRSSLRGSQKLRALEKKYFSENSGIENSAFQLEEGDAVDAPEIQDEKSVDGKLVGSVPDNEPPELTKTYTSTELSSMLRNVASVLNEASFDGDLMLLERLFHNPEFHSVLWLHNKVQELNCFSCIPTPVSIEAFDLSNDVRSDILDVPLKEAEELNDILSRPEFEHMLLCHDGIAQRQATPDVSEEEEILTRVSQYPEESIKIVRIDKSSEPLGATVKNEGDAVVIGRIVKGGVAEKSGLLHEGDEILEVNGMEIRGKSVNDVCDIMAGMCGTLTFLIVPCQGDTDKEHHSPESVVHLKAHFDYEPDDDLYIPCRELGMSFQKGDVLHVISHKDPNWWQAYREGEEDQMLAGLIPSKTFQQQRELMKQAVVGDIQEKKSKKVKLLCARRHHRRRKKKKLYNLNYNDDTDSEQILTYEEVMLYYPRAHVKRPLVLIGPQKIGRQELRQRLMEDTNRFAAAVPHTSRQKKDNEVNGVDYYFISRVQFEADILAGRFVEHGEYQKSYYGTSIDAIRAVIGSAKTCVLNLHPQSLKIMKKSDLMPYVVFIAPPSFEKLRQNCLKTDPTIKDEELKDIIEKAREMEEFYGHYFDLVLINVDLDKTYSELLHSISVIEREPQWVPACWIKDINPS